MKLNRLLSAAALLCLIRAYKHHRQEKNLQTVDSVDVEQDMGKWILSRTPTIDKKQLKQYLQHAKKQDYALDQLIFSSHD
ncbi:lipocalin family protein [Rappaport israeli]|uniref:lipocalin family protein n=1 Tax=Rappaport israeli TaxID=1839807 RepID=UPI00093054F9|nr:lipocalin family protein [Rappaport israeli]